MSTFAECLKQHIPKFNCRLKSFYHKKKQKHSASLFNECKPRFKLVALNEIRHIIRQICIHQAMDIVGLIQHFKVKLFYYVLYNFQKPQRETLQSYIENNRLRAYFAIAHEYSYRKYQFLLFNDVQHFQCFYAHVDSAQRCFYSMYLFRHRYLYMDIDLEIDTHIADIDLHRVSHQFIECISNTFSNENIKWHFETNYANPFTKCIVFDSSRCIKSGKKYKVSLHLFNRGVTWNTVEDMMHDIKTLKTHAIAANRETNANTLQMRLKNNITYYDLIHAIDLSVYDQLQLMRQPESHKFGEPLSTKRILFGISKECDILTKIIVNQSDNIEWKTKIWAPYLNTQSDVKLKIRTLKVAISKTKNTHVRCTEINFTNDRCYMCSDSSNYIILYDFESRTNELKWQELRCRNSGCGWKVYKPINTTVEYPRSFANIPLGKSQIEKIFGALNTFGIVIIDPYKYIFIDHKIREINDAIIIPFTKFTSANAIAQCGHTPEQLKCRKPSNKFIKKMDYTPFNAMTVSENFTTSLRLLLFNLTIVSHK